MSDSKSSPSQNHSSSSNESVDSVENKHREDLHESDEITNHMRTKDESLADTAGTSDGALSPQLTSRIFELNIDCFEELFEWLSFKDLLALRQTCKQFKKIVDYYIKEYYPAVKIGYGILRLQRPYIGRLRFLDPIIIKSIKKLRLDVIDLSLAEISIMKDLLSHIEVLDLGNWEIEHDFYEVFLQFCPKLKYLSIDEVSGDTLMGAGNQWLLRQYPLLENFAIKDSIDAFYEGKEITQLETFFRINPNIRTFSTTLHFLWENRNWLRGSNIQFDQLNVEFFPTVFLDVDDINNMFGLVHELYQDGLFKKLHFYGLCVYAEEMSQISLLPALEKVHLREVEENLIVPPSLKVLNLYNGSDIKNPEVLAKNIPNVEHIYLRTAKLTDILPFIRLSASVREIRVADLENGTYFQNGIINLNALNEERRKLNGAKKITIYVWEQICLSMKWAGIKTSCTLLELRRAEKCRRESAQPFNKYIYQED